MACGASLHAIQQSWAKELTKQTGIVTIVSRAPTAHLGLGHGEGASRGWVQFDRDGTNVSVGEINDGIIMISDPKTHAHMLDPSKHIAGRRK